MFRPRNTLEDGLHNEGLLTVSQVFDLTPAAEDILEKCGYRNSSFHIISGSAEECNAAFNISKFAYLEYMCYEIEAAKHWHIKTSYVTKATFFTGYLYSLSFKSEVTKSHLVYVFLFKGALSSSQESVFPLKVKGGENKTTSNILYLSPHMQTSIFLEAPYNTRCIKKNEDEVPLCRRRCIIDAMKEINRVPAFEAINYPINRTFLPTKDITKERTRNFLLRSYDLCKQSCFFNPCKDTLTQTLVDGALDDNQQFAIGVMVPLQPDVITTYKPSMTFVEFFSFICGCFGTWFGLSFLSLFPLQRMLKREKFVVKFPDRTWVCQTM